MAANLVGLGWIEPIDQANVPDCVANVRDELKGLPWDPDMKYHYPWQSGATGVGYNSASTGRELTKVADLFDPAFGRSPSDRGPRHVPAHPPRAAARTPRR
jgi:spermidine/putrescine transport system substrate-binding protein